MKKPHVTFHLNRALDKTMVVEFLKFGEKAGFDFEKEVVKDHPNLKGKGKDLDYIGRYVDTFYDSNKDLLTQAKKDFQKKWDGVEDNFYKLVDSIFDGQSWSQGKYRGYISIIQCGPRFLDTKEFQSSYKWERNIISQVIHEMLHFQFYEMVKNEGIDADEDKIWKMSEIFDDIVQKEEPFVKLQGYAVGVSYPGHASEFEKYKKIWDETHSAKKFINKTLR